MAIVNVQSNFATAAGSGTSLGATLNGVGAGAAIIFYATNDSGGGGSVSGVADDLAVAANLAHGWDDITGFIQYYSHWSFQNHAGGNRTFTATYSVSAPFRAVAVVELSGAEPTGTLNGPATHNNGTSAAPSSGAVTPANDGAYFFGTVQGQSTTPAAAAPFSHVLDITANLTNVEDYVQAIAANLAATWTMASAFWSATVSTYYAAVSVPTPKIIVRESFGAVLTEDNRFLL